jgi:hypothetical protein
VTREINMVRYIFISFFFFCTTLFHVKFLLATCHLCV